MREIEREKTLYGARGQTYVKPRRPKTWYRQTIHIYIYKYTKKLQTHSVCECHKVRINSFVVSRLPLGKGTRFD